MDYAKLSKEISYILRHKPEAYGLTLDDDGWIDLDILVHKLNSIHESENIVQQDIIDMIDKSKKKRHEIREGKIRASYGHSLPTKIEMTPSVPPSTLYHGTDRRFVDSIAQKGLCPQLRQYVHLSKDIETALSVGSRHGNQPVIFKVHALKAHQDGITFYTTGNDIWLADTIPFKYLNEMEDK